jgi:hypothetical protein
MKKLLAALVLGAAVFAAGCTTTTMHRIVYRPIVGSAANGNFSQIAETALTRRGWQITARRDGAIDASYAADDQHRADITIAYTAASYNIEYRGSEGLDYSRGRIHRHYNNWINNLDYDIQRAMGNVRR